MIDTKYNLEELIKENSNLIYSICSKYSKYMDIEDLYQVGVIGLINAYNHFDIGKNVKFSTYAFTFIVGEVSKFVRENQNIKVSRDLIRLGKKLNEYIEKHKKVRGYEPSIEDISSMFEIPKEKVINALEACKITTKSLNEELNDDGKIITLLDITPSKELISNDKMLDLKEAFKYLNNDEKKLIINRYYNDYTQSEVAKELGVNQVYVSRLEKKALTKMKDKMIS